MREKVAQLYDRVVDWALTKTLKTVTPEVFRAADGYQRRIIAKMEAAERAARGDPDPEWRAKAERAIDSHRDHLEKTYQWKEEWERQEWIDLHGGREVIGSTPTEAQQNAEDEFMERQDAESRRDEFDKQLPPLRRPGGQPELRPGDYYRIVNYQARSGTVIHKKEYVSRSTNMRDEQSKATEPSDSSIERAERILKIAERHQSAGVYDVDKAVKEIAREIDGAVREGQQPQRNERVAGGMRPPETRGDRDTGPSR